MTKYTPNLNLALYEGSDAPALDDQYNESMRILDEQVQAAKESSAGWEAAVLRESQLRTAADIELQRDIDAVREESTATASSVDAFATRLGAAETKITQNTSKANAAQEAANNAQTSANNANAAAASALTHSQGVEQELQDRTTLKKGDKITLSSNGAIIYGCHFLSSGKTVARFFIPTNKPLASGADKPTTATISGNALIIAANGGLVNSNANGTGRPLSEYATWTGTVTDAGIMIAANSTGTWQHGGAAIPGTLGVILYPTGNTTITLA